MIGDIYLDFTQEMKHQILNGVQWTPTFISSEVGLEKIKANKWVERSPKMKNLHRCYCLQKFSKYEKTTKT